MNFVAAYKTSKSHNLNEKAVNLHMLEDVLGWLLVFIGSIIMKFFDVSVIDPILSIGISIFMIINVSKNLHSIFDIFLEKTPKGIDIEHIKTHLMSIDGVIDVHHIHIWTMDGISNYATIHALVKDKVDMIEMEKIKKNLKKELLHHEITHSTIEFEIDKCSEVSCKNKNQRKIHAHHHHH